MSDFETLLTEALTSGAEQAPGAAGLAAGARTRARARRRSRSGLAAGFIVAVVAVPTAVLAFNGVDSPHRHPVATDPTDEAPGGWHAVEYEGVVVDVPGDWRARNESGCEFAPADLDACRNEGERITFYRAAIYDAASSPGFISSGKGIHAGYVYAGDWAVFVVDADRAEALRILGSARVEGQEAPDLSEGWRTETHESISVEVPGSWRAGALSAWCLNENVDGWVEPPELRGPDVDCVPSSNGYGIRFVGGLKAPPGRGEPTRRSGGQDYPDGAWVGHAVPAGANGYITVVAPTQAVAELVLSNARKG